MGVKVSIKSKGEDLHSMVKRLQAVDGIGVEVGVLKGESKWLAGIHEYGLNIEVTEKMRKYLASQGLYLRKETTHIHIPERSFLRSGFDKYQDDVAKKGQQLLLQVADGKMSARGCMQALGMELASKIKDYAVELDSPANHPFTTDRKGSSKPLVDTGDMIGGITWRKAK